MKEKDSMDYLAWMVPRIADKAVIAKCLSEQGARLLPDSHEARAIESALHRIKAELRECGEKLAELFKGIHT